MASPVGISPTDIANTIIILGRVAAALCGAGSITERKELEACLRAVSKVLEDIQHATSNGDPSLTAKISPCIENISRLVTEFEKKMKAKGAALPISGSEIKRSLKQKFSNGKGAIVWEFCMKAEAEKLIPKLHLYLGILQIFLTSRDRAISREIYSKLQERDAAMASGPDENLATTTQVKILHSVLLDALKSLEERVSAKVVGSKREMMSALCGQQRIERSRSIRARLPKQKSPLSGNLGHPECHARRAEPINPRHEPENSPWDRIRALPQSSNDFRFTVSRLKSQSSFVSIPCSKSSSGNAQIHQIPHELAIIEHTSDRQRPSSCISFISNSEEILSKPHKETNTEKVENNEQYQSADDENEGIDWDDDQVFDDISNQTFKTTTPQNSSEIPQEHDFFLDILRHEAEEDLKAQSPTQASTNESLKAESPTSETRASKSATSQAEAFRDRTNFRTIEDCSRVGRTCPLHLIRDSGYLGSEVPDFESQEKRFVFYEEKSTREEPIGNSVLNLLFHGLLFHGLLVVFGGEVNNLEWLARTE
ncbi:hypothetical protein EG329_011441 [Mollisiaceae sp. DMI_Dod_QoI]|nr:hypothetical protein EG329_011441 [Helotiales sp. DMI_Dod_QoI]